MRTCSLFLPQRGVTEVVDAYFLVLRVAKKRKKGAKSRLLYGARFILCTVYGFLCGKKNDVQ